MNPVKAIKSLNMFERVLWCISLTVVTISYVLVSEKNYIAMIASLIGVTALIFVSKANALGQLLTVIFSLFYGVVSLSYAYYGEMLTYLCMTAPIAVVALISWLRHPFDNNSQEVEVKHLNRSAVIFVTVTTIIVTAVFLFILKALNTNNLLLSTVSIATSFVASYLTYKRSPYYALAYSANDIVLIFLWIFATMENSGYASMIICFVMFLVNDMYGFINWNKIKKRQSLSKGENNV